MGGRHQRPGLVGKETQANRSHLVFLVARPAELVLDHIVERKRLDDLCSSIIDGRFREQKVPWLACPTGLLGEAFLEVELLWPPAIPL
jgi:hypothetical protein